LSIIANSLRLSYTQICNVVIANSVHFPHRSAMWSQRIFMRESSRLGALCQNGVLKRWDHNECCVRDHNLPAVRMRSTLLGKQVLKWGSRVLSPCLQLLYNNSTGIPWDLNVCESYRLFDNLMEGEVLIHTCFSLINASCVIIHSWHGNPGWLASVGHNFFNLPAIAVQAWTACGFAVHSTRSLHCKWSPLCHEGTKWSRAVKVPFQPSPSREGVSP
jgi:hypothetical protein